MRPSPSLSLSLFYNHSHWKDQPADTPPPAPCRCVHEPDLSQGEVVTAQKKYRTERSRRGNHLFQSPVLLPPTCFFPAGAAVQVRGAPLHHPASLCKNRETLILVGTSLGILGSFESQSGFRATRMILVPRHEIGQGIELLGMRRAPVAQQWGPCLCAWSTDVQEM